VKPASASDLLQHIHPFRFLRGHRRNVFATLFRELRVDPGEMIFRQGDADDSVYLVAEGTLEIVELRGGRDEPVTVVGPRTYFGEWEAIFHEPRTCGARARTACRLFVVGGDDFRRLLHSSPFCAQGFATILRDNQGIFSAFDRFTARLFKEADEGHVNIDGLLPLYKALHPAIHGGATEEHRLDGAALQYAVRRLPENVTRCFAFLLVDEFPHAFDEAGRLFPVIDSSARRRDIWEMMPGKNMVLLRNGRSDLIDLVTCLCLYATEARKIRERLIRCDMVMSLRAYLNGEITESDEREFLGTLPFSSRETGSVCQTWPGETVQRLYEICRHREMFSIDVRRQRRNYNIRRGEFWTAEVARVTRELIGYDPSDIPPERGVHIVSSNTHSLTNCLNPWFQNEGQRILQWGEDSGHDVMRDEWKHGGDRVYALARDFFLARPEAAGEAREVGAMCGQLRLDQTASTGIQVQLIDLERLHGRRFDPGVHPITAGAEHSRDLVVNIDYAFGHQAEHIIRNLLMLFGENVRSVNLLGKAGALAGARGDILIPTAFIEQQTDYFQPLPASQMTEGASLENSFAVHRGPMLTVEGTLLQNRHMLHFYREIWDVVALEMEGAHYFREILEARQLGVTSRAVQCRFLYYTSDLPLNARAGLTAPLAPTEGIPALYAVTRAILNQIVSGGSA
jgi:CRP-like cAMP-binding protein